MAIKLGKREIEKLLKNPYSEEAKLIKMFGLEKGKKLIDKISNGKAELINLQLENEISLRYSKEKDEKYSMPYNAITAYNKNGAQIGQICFKLDKIITLTLLTVDKNVDNRNAIGEELLKQLEKIGKTIGSSHINGRYYPCMEGEFKFDELYKETGYSLDSESGRWYELWREIPEKAAVAVDDKEEIELE